MKKIVLKSVAFFLAFCLVVAPLVVCVTVCYLVDSTVMRVTVVLAMVLSYYYMQKMCTSKKVDFLISRHNFNGNKVFFEMLPDGTCGYYFKWYENGKGFRSEFYEFTTKAPEDIQDEIKSASYPQSQKVKDFIQELVVEYFEKNK